MQVLSREELLQINGGINLNGTMLQYIFKGFSFVFDLGRYIGSAIRRAEKGQLCPIS